MKCGIYFRFNSWSLEAANCQLSFFLLSICPDILHQSRYQITIFNKLALGNFLNTNFFPVVSVVKFTTFTCSKLTTETLEESLNICLKLTIQTPERQWLLFDFFIVNFELFHVVLVFLSLTLKTYLPAAGLPQRNDHFNILS